MEFVIERVAGMDCERYFAEAALAKRKVASRGEDGDAALQLMEVSIASSRLLTAWMRRIGCGSLRWRRGEVLGSHCVSGCVFGLRGGKLRGWVHAYLFLMRTILPREAETSVSFPSSSRALCKSTSSSSFRADLWLNLFFVLSTCFAK